MRIDTMDQKVKELWELRRMQDELSTEIETIQDELKSHMDAHGMDTPLGFGWKITWKNVTSNRLDSTALKKDLPDIAARFMKQSYRPPVRAGMRKAPCITADQSTMQGTRTKTNRGPWFLQCTTTPSVLQGRVES